nr:7707_t:CDS:2 [Entrophospora candida]
MITIQDLRGSKCQKDLKKQESIISSPVKSHPQILMGGIWAIPDVADAVASSLCNSTMMSPLMAYSLLILLVIAVIWFVRRMWAPRKISKNLNYVQEKIQIEK